MDPNQALKDLRAAVEVVINDSSCCAEHGAMAGEELAQQFKAFDWWLAKGGFPPEEWVH